MHHSQCVPFHRSESWFNGAVVHPYVNCLIDDQFIHDCQEKKVTFAAIDYLPLCVCIDDASFLTFLLLVFSMYTYLCFLLFFVVVVEFLGNYLH